MTREQNLLAFVTAASVSLLLLLGVGEGFLKSLPTRIRNTLRACKRAVEWVQLWLSGRYIKVAGLKLSDTHRLRHSHIVGASGSGKTNLLEQLIEADIRRGLGCVVIDPKGDRALFERVSRICSEAGRLSDLHLLSAQYYNESRVWNPCGLGGSSELQSKFQKAAIYSEPHYEKHAEAALLQIFTELLRQEPDGFALPHVVERLKKYSIEIKEKNVEGLSLDLFNLAKSEWSEVLGCRGKIDASREVSILDIVQENQILFVDLPTESKMVQSQRVGRLLLQELTIISGLRKTHTWLKRSLPLSLYIDEFDVFGIDAFAVFMNKARSSDFMIHLAHQTLSDLEKISPYFAGQIMGNTNIRFIFRQDLPQDAETWASLFGTRKVVKKTWRSSAGQETGESSNRDANEFVVGPDVIKQLSTGECIYSNKEAAKLRKLKLPLASGRRINQRIFPVLQRRIKNMFCQVPQDFELSTFKSRPELKARKILGANSGT